MRRNGYFAHTLKIHHYKNFLKIYGNTRAVTDKLKISVL
jgi:hypothetical protein